MSMNRDHMNRGEPWRAQISTQQSLTVNTATWRVAALAPQSSAPCGSSGGQLLLSALPLLFRVDSPRQQTKGGGGSQAAPAVHPTDPRVDIGVASRAGRATARQALKRQKRQQDLSECALLRPTVSYVEALSTHSPSQWPVWGASRSDPQFQRRLVTMGNCGLDLVDPPQPGAWDPAGRPAPRGRFPRPAQLSLWTSNQT